MSRRGRRGNGRDRFTAPASPGAKIDDDAEDIIVTDEEGTVIEGGSDEIIVVAAEDREPLVTDRDRGDDDAFKALQRQFDDMKTKREEAEARNREYEVQSQAREVDAISTQRALLEHAASSAASALKDAKNRFKTAMAVSDFDAATEAQADIAAAQLDVRNYDLAKDQFESTIEDGKAQRQVKASEPVDQVEATIQSFTPATQQWARKNRDDVFSNEKRFNKAIAAHWNAVSEGIQPDTSEYFSFLDKEMGYSGDAKGANAKRDTKPARPVMAAAPVSRGSGGSTTVELTQAQREMAGRMNMSLTKYAKNLKELTEKGRDPNWRGPRLSQFDGNQKG